MTPAHPIPDPTRARASRLLDHHHARGQGARPVPHHVIGQLGDAGTVLLAGPPAGAGPEGLGAHLDRNGPLPGVDDPDVARHLVACTGLTGRGGAGFPTSDKLRSALGARGQPLLVVNASESEPLSRKDRLLVAHRPHLVLDGAAILARAAGAGEAVVRLHEGSAVAEHTLREAMAERARARLPDPGWRLSLGPDRYVAGEAGAVANAVAGRAPLPSFRAVPLAAGGGPGGRPILVHNVETLAHLAVAARMGPRRWAATGGGRAGTTLVTVAAPGSCPGWVLEVVGRATVGDVLVSLGTIETPLAVLLGGFAGTWVDGEVARRTVLAPDALADIGASIGCGLVAPLPSGACGLVETARIASYLAGESAGSCGPCVHGLAELARLTEALARGTLRRRGLRRVHDLLAMVRGRGACGHPDGAVGMIGSALEAFRGDVTEHLAGRPCAGARGTGVFAVPGGRC